MNDSVAPHRGGYWLADFADQDMVGRVWHDDQEDTWRFDLTLADEVAYNGTPETFGTADKRDEAQAEVERFIDMLTAEERARCFTCGEGEAHPMHQELADHAYKRSGA